MNILYGSRVADQMDNSCQIMLARPEHLAALPRIERAAAEIFPAGMIPEEVKN